MLRLPRVYPILDCAALEARGLSVERAAGAMIAGGAKILQIRRKGHWPRDFVEEARRVRERCRADGVLFVVNDRADFAELLDAALHVGQDDLTPSEARKLIGPGRALGFSTHNEAQLLAGVKEPVDYLALGPVFATRSKENPDPEIGLERWAAWRKRTDRPVVAIGGITRSNALDVLSAGADSVAVIGDLIHEEASEESLRRRMEEWRQLAG
jgi:thiamine-phosphate pyrophosphorylase